MDWTAEAIEQLRALWQEGHSTAEIGRRMGISKNAVVGKAHRLNLPARPSPIRREAAAAGAAPATAPARRPAAAPALRRPTAPQPAPTPAVAAAPAAAPALAAVAPPPVAVVAPAHASATASAPAPAAAPVRAAAPAPAVVRPFPRLGQRTCCWPLGEPGTPEFRFCTSEALTGKPYCAEHASLAYVKARDRREDAA